MKNQAIITIIDGNSKNIFHKGNIVKSNITNNCVLITRDSTEKNPIFEGVTLGDDVASYNQGFEKKYYKQFVGEILLKI